MTATTAYPALSPDDAVAAVLQGFPDETFAHLALAPDDSGLNVENRLDMSATVNAASSSDVDVLRAGWEGCLADGAPAEYLVRDSNNLGTAVQGRVVARPSNASTRQPAGCSGNIAFGQLFGAQSDHSTDAEIITSITAALAGVGITPDRVEVLRPLGPAVDVTVTAPGAVPLLASGTALRAGTGSSWESHLAGATNPIPQ